jgi:hypothetical protein
VAAGETGHRVFDCWLEMAEDGCMHEEEEDGKATGLTALATSRTNARTGTPSATSLETMRRPQPPVAPATATEEIPSNLQGEKQKQ